MSKVKVSNVRIAFIKNLWTPTEFKAGDGKFRHGATFLIEKDSANDKAVRAEIMNVATAAWNTNAKKILADIVTNNQKFCYLFEKTNKEGDVNEGFEGMMSLASNRGARKGPVLIVDQDGRTVLTENSGRLYGGCYVNATIDIWAQTGEFGPAIRAVPIGIQLVEQGDAFSGAPPASLDDFEDLTDGKGADDFGPVYTGGSPDPKEDRDPLAGFI